MRKIKYSLLALALAGVVTLLSVAFPYPPNDPSVWPVLAEMTGLRPSTSATPLLWRFLVAHGVALDQIGQVSLFVFAASLLALLGRMLVLRLSPTEKFRSWWRFTLPSVTTVGTLLAVFSEPVWRLAQTGSPALLTLALLLLTTNLFFAPFFMLPRIDVDAGVSGNSLAVDVCQLASFALAGFLAVESPLALALPVLFVAGRNFLERCIKNGRYAEYPYDVCVLAPERCTSWLAVSAWCAGAGVGAWLVSASGLGFATYVRGLAGDLCAAASLVGWALWLCLALAPAVFAVILVSRVKRLDSGLGFAMFAIGLVACLSLVPVGKLHYWVFLSAPTVTSPFMLALGVTLSAIAVTLSLAYFAYFAYHAMQVNDAPRRSVTLLVAFVQAALALVALEGLSAREARAIRQVIADAMDETALEAEDARWLYTDGSCDMGIALAARRRRLSFEILPMIGPAGKVAQLREWVAGGSTNLAETAVQLGFELWSREGMTPLTASGFVARPGEFSDAERGRKAADALGERMKALVSSGAVRREGDPAVRAAFSSLLGRLAYLMRFRGETKQANELDAANGALQSAAEKDRNERPAAFLQLTDVEGLELALKRADFVEARRFAVSVLKRNEKDVSANFGMGMSYLLEDKLDDAKLYLERAHRQKPTEPAILNNLAIVHLRQGDLATAEELANKALERAPRIAEIQDTVRRIREAKSK